MGITAPTVIAAYAVPQLDIVKGENRPTMSTNEPPNVTYRFVVTATIDGHSAPLSIEGSSINEIRRAVRLLDTNGMISSTPPAQPTDEAPRCPVHHRPMKPSKKPGAWFCTAKVADGYCDQKVG